MGYNKEGCPEAFVRWMRQVFVESHPACRNVSKALCNSLKSRHQGRQSHANGSEDGLPYIRTG